LAVKLFDAGNRMIDAEYFLTHSHVKYAIWRQKKTPLLQGLNDPKQANKQG
jgi:hypothetical protein